MTKRNVEEAMGLVVLVALFGIVIWGIAGKVELDSPAPSSIVETRREHLVFESDGCKVYQVRIEDKDGVRYIYVAVNPAASKRPTTANATCRIAH